MYTLILWVFLCGLPAPACALGPYIEYDTYGSKKKCNESEAVLRHINKAHRTTCIYDWKGP